MNDAKKHLDAGELSKAVEAGVNLVKTNPGDPRARIFLFELSLFSGDWDRAERQLDVISHQDHNAMIGGAMYKGNIKAEQDRLKYFSEALKPETMTASPSYINDLLDANKRVIEGNIAEARQILDRVEEERPAFPCKVNGESFSDIRDYNDLTMCVLEVVFKGSYLWLPFQEIVKIEFFKPKLLRDLYWVHGNVELLNGTNGEMFFPALYAGTSKSDDDQVRLGRMNDWRDLGEELFVGEGTKAFWMDGRVKSLLDIETIEFEHENLGIVE